MNKKLKSHARDLFSDAFCNMQGEGNSNETKENSIKLFLKEVRLDYPKYLDEDDHKEFEELLENKLESILNENWENIVDPDPDMNEDNYAEALMSYLDTKKVA